MGAYASEKILIEDFPVVFTPALLAHKNNLPAKAVFVVEFGPIRVTLDGTDPTSTTGIPIDIGAVVTITKESDIQNFKAIRSTNVSSVINPEYFNNFN